MLRGVSSGMTSRSPDKALVIPIWYGVVPFDDAAWGQFWYDFPEPGLGPISLLLFRGYQPFPLDLRGALSWWGNLRRRGV